MSRPSEQEYEEFKENGKKKGKNPWVVAAIFGVTAILCLLITYFAGNLDPVLKMLGLI